jgi:hypothetical protein
MGFLDWKIGQSLLKSSPKTGQAHVWPFNRLCMKNSLWEKSHADHHSAGSCGRKTLLSVNSCSIDGIAVRACRRNNLEAMAQLTLYGRSIEE